MAMAQLGADIEVDGGFVVARAPRGLRGGEIVFPKVTVGGTHTAIMAASLANGTTVIDNAAQEPETADIADSSTRWARAFPAPARRIIVDGVAKLHGARHAVLPDRIETGTSSWRSPWPAATSCCRTRGPNCCRPHSMFCSRPAPRSREQSGRPDRPQRRRIGAGRGVDRAISRLPDRSAGAADGADDARAGVSRITETIFENRFMHVGELTRLGARIHLDGERATIEGVEQLKGAPVMATDLRASVSLVIAALLPRARPSSTASITSTAVLSGVEEKLGRCGAAIERLSG